PTAATFRQSGKTHLRRSPFFKRRLAEMEIPPLTGHPSTGDQRTALSKA
ncbi:854_t:CDS:2, partial [Paraglomus occultum]